MGNISLANIKSNLTGWARYLNQYKTALTEVIYPRDNFGNVINESADLGSDLIRFEELRCKNLSATQMLAWRSGQTASADLTAGEKIQISGSYTFGASLSGSFDVTVGSNPFTICAGVQGSFSSWNFRITSSTTLSQFFSLTQSDSKAEGLRSSKGIPLILPAGTHTIYYVLGGNSGSTIEYNLSIFELI